MAATETVERHGVAPGLAVCALAVALSTAAAGAVGAPSVALCLIFGLLLRAVLERSSWASGMELAATHGLRVGVALIGLRIGGLDAALLGAAPLLAGLVVLVGLVVGVIGARLLRLSNDVGLVSGAAVGICGVSAALAVASALPKRAQAERDVGAVIAYVTVLSSAAMLAWPIAAALLPWSATELGAAIGGSVHDVAQATAAGYAVSAEVGAAAAVAKMSRVAMLAPVLILVPLLCNARSWRLSAMPWYLPAFIVLAILSSMHVIDGSLLVLGQTVSQMLLAAALVAIGYRTSLAHLLEVGWRIPTLLVTESVLIIAAASAAALWLF